MDRFFQDVRYALRTLRKSPMFTVIAVVCLSVGIAANTTLFSVMNAMVFRPLPFPSPDQIVFGSDRFKGSENSSNSISYPTYVDWRDQLRGVTIGATSGRSLTITEGDEPERLFGQLVSASLFPLLGVTPQLGRVFREDEDRAGAPGVVLLSDGVWRRRYGGDSSVINRVISINNQAYTVVGVMPPRFRFPEDSDMWVPIAPLLSNSRREARSLLVYGRLHDNTTLDQAEQELKNISSKLNAQYDPNTPWSGHFRTLESEFREAEVTTMVYTMFGAVTLVLIIACANVANLMMTRAAGRQREIAVRAAIGAGRGRIIRQLLTESLMLATLAGIVAIPLTWVGLKLIDAGIPPENPLPWYFHWGLDTETLLYTIGIAVATSVAFGLIPALQVSRGRLYDALREGGGRGAFGSAKRNKLRSALVIAEVALSLVLLVGASLFARTFFGLQGADAGFDTERMMTLRFYMPGQRYDSVSSQMARVQDLVQRIEALPQIEAAAASNSTPMESCCPGSGIIIEAQRVEAGTEPQVQFTGVFGHWFETLNVKLVAGRSFNDLEMGSRAPVAVIDERMAKRFWPTTNALGQRFRLDIDTTMSFEVIGIVPNTRIGGVDDDAEPDPMAYLPFQFLTSRNTGILMRVRAGAPSSVMPQVREAIRAADPTMAVFDVQTMDKVRTLSFWEYKLFSQMFGTFGAIALLLAAIGVYGVISYGVSQRTQEIGVRVALGAQGKHVLTMVMREAGWLAGIGIAIGVVGAFGITRVIAQFLIGVSPTDPISFGSVALFLAGVALFASWVPARRATRVDPLVALRNE
ncbi:MAG TPA: ABC transporter permease [Gemmatimonadaceae bacterium]|nr:ABC transporter permease [Gemmatimonadaceae bacterium]